MPIWQQIYRRATPSDRHSPALRWTVVLNQLLEGTSDHARAELAILTVDVLSSYTFLDFHTSLSHREFAEQYCSPRYPQFFADDIVECWIGASSKENKIADHAESIEYVDHESVGYEMRGVGLCKRGFLYQGVEWRKGRA